MGKIEKKLNQTSCLEIHEYPSHPGFWRQIFVTFLEKLSF